jgi:hypothetical protein
MENVIMTVGNGADETCQNQVVSAYRAGLASLPCLVIVPFFVPSLHQNKAQSGTIHRIRKTQAPS